MGAVLDPNPAYLLDRGLKTLDVRIERQCQSALGIARWLEGHEQVARVNYPGLDSHPDREIALAQLRAGGSMLSFVAKGGYEAAVRVADALQEFARAPSLGGTESLITLPRTTSHHGLSEAELETVGIDPGLVRLSIGLEPIERLIADLAQSLSIG